MSGPLPQVEEESSWRKIAEPKMDLALFERFFFAHACRSVRCKLTGRIIRLQDLESLEGKSSASRFLKKLLEHYYFTVIKNTSSLEVITGFSVTNTCHSVIIRATGHANSKQFP